MDTALLDKEVLCIIDTRQVQKFIFSSGSMAESIGANLLLKHIRGDAFAWAAENIAVPMKREEYLLPEDPVEDSENPFPDLRIRARVMLSAAGNMMILFRTGALCQDMVRKMSRYYLDHGYTLQIASACVEKTDNIEEDIGALYRALAISKNNYPGAHPLEALPVARIEKKTGEPVAFVDPVTGEEFSRTSLIRRREYERMKKAYSTKGVHTVKGWDGREYYAVAHIDGNNMGLKIAGILNQAKSYADNIRIRNRIERNLTEGINGVVERAKDELQNAFGFSAEEMENEFRIVHMGGDDLNIIASPSAIFCFVERYMANLRKILLWDKGGTPVGMSACAGIAFVEKNTSFLDAFEVAEECCASAKKVAKKKENCPNGKVGNWVDFRVVYPYARQEGDNDREKVYTTPDGIRLMLRPYCFDKNAAGTPRDYNAFRERAETFHTLGMTGEMASRVMQAYDLGKGDVNLMPGILAGEGCPVPEKCGNPLVRYGDGVYALWYDALELQEFFPAEERGAKK